METRERLFSELRTVCTTAGLDFEGVKTELSEFVEGDRIVDYYITKGKQPSFPDTVFDVMVLGKKGLYDYDMRQKGVLLHFESLSKIAEIAEVFQGDDYLTVNFRVGGLGGGVALQEKLSESKNIRMFARAVRNEIGER